MGNEAGAHRCVALGRLRVRADDKALVFRELHFFHLEVPGHFPVAAGPGKRGLGFCGSGAQLLPHDVVVIAAAQVAAVLSGSEAPVGHPDDPGEGPLPEIGFHLADEGGVGRVAGPGPDPHRNTFSRDGQADHDLRQVVPVVLALAVGAESGGDSGRPLFIITVTHVPEHLAPSVPLDGFIGFVYAEVGGGGVEEQEINLQVEEIGHLMEDRLLESGGDQKKEVHGPVEGVIGYLGKPGDLHVSLHPFRCGQLGGGTKRPTRHQSEEGPFGLLVPATRGKEAGDGLSDPQRAPQDVKDVGSTHRSGLHESEVGKLRGKGLVRPAGVQIAGDGADQTLERLPGTCLFPAEVIKDLGLRTALVCVPDVVGQLQVANDMSVFSGLAGGAEVHT